VLDADRLGGGDPIGAQSRDEIGRQSLED